MIVTLAGPGAGKTTDLIRQIEEVIPRLSSNRELAVVTYTNASADDLREKLIVRMNIPKNLFIGTIHSFLFKYYIQSFAQEMGYKTSGTVIVDKFSDAGVDWIDNWAKKNVDAERRTQAVNGMKLKNRNLQIDAAAKKGIYTFDGIIKISKLLSEDKQISNAISNRIQYLFVDEYQDVDKYCHNIIMELHKRKKTIISIVGDPDQSIYRFRYGNSQIGEKAPQSGKQPLNEIIALCERSDDIECRELTTNHRSSKEIVEFNNQYGTLSTQVAEKGSVCPVQFIDSTDIMGIKSALLDEGKKHKCESYLILAKDNSTIQVFESILESTVQNKAGYYDLNHIVDIFISDTGLSKMNFKKKYGLSKFQMRRVAVSVRTALLGGKISQDEISEYCGHKFQELYSVNLDLKNAQTHDDKGKPLVYGYKSEVEHAERIYSGNIRCMTIHKAKGLEADGVLVVAKTEAEMLKWLNMTKTNMKSDTDELYRLGYVAFTRPRKMLLLACKESIDLNKIKPSVKVRRLTC
jgi:DNA helicase-2/ATP-dependent DNA helicase PcrA